MPFKEVLGLVVKSVRGGVGAILVDDEGEAVDVFTRGDGYEIRLAGAHHGVIIALLEEAIQRMEQEDNLQGLSFTSQHFIYTAVPVQEGLYVVLMQDKTGIPSQGMKVLKDSVSQITALI